MSFFCKRCGRRHFYGARLVEKFYGVLVPLRGGALQPEKRRVAIAGDAAPGKIHLPEVVLSAGVAMRCRRTHPFERLWLALLNAAPRPVQRRQLVLRLRVADRCAPLQRLGSRAVIAGSDGC